MPDVLEWKRNIEVLREIIKKQTLRFGIKSSGYANFKNSIILLLFLLACIRLSIIVLLYFVYDYFEIPT